MDLNFLRQNRSDQPLGGRYKIVESLGAGGFGQTFRAQDLHLPGHPLCVVKQLKPQVEDAEGLQVARRLFDTEAKVLYQLGSYPQIPLLLAHFEDNKEFYLAQELIEGHSLADEFDITPWDIPKVVNFLRDVLETLTFVHGNRVIHRDLKPSNLIRRDKDSRIVLIDFGAVKQAGTQPAGSGIVHTISIGTHGYMPSEQLAGQPQFSSDVYAVGIMAIQAITGLLPKQLMPHEQTGEIDWHPYAPKLHPELRDVLDTMVRYDFRARYPSAREALNAMASLPQELVQPTPVPSQIPSLKTEPAPSDLTGITVAAMGQPEPSVVKAASRRPKATVVAADTAPQKTRLVPTIVIGFLILGVGLLIGRACTSAGVPNNAETTVDDTVTTTTSPPEQPALPEETSTETIPTSPPALTEETNAETIPTSLPEQLELSEETSTDTIPTSPEPSEPPALPNPPEEASTELTPATAQLVVADFYSYLSSRSWEAARSQTGGALAQQFDPGFFEQFDQVSVENLQVIEQTPERIEFLGQNTYVYSDGSIQIEERTFTVQPVDGQPRIIESEFRGVTQSR
ncbi:MAG: serine/threonine-protein kinase [Cyanobacteria bacterium P01_B01_bin.77]